MTLGRWLLTSLVPYSRSCRSWWCRRAVASSPIPSSLPSSWLPLSQTRDPFRIPTNIIIITIVIIITTTIIIIVIFINITSRKSLRWRGSFWLCTINSLNVFCIFFNVSIVSFLLSSALALASISRLNVIESSRLSKDGEVDYDMLVIDRVNGINWWTGHWMNWWIEEMPISSSPSPSSSSSSSSRASLPCCWWICYIFDIGQVLKDCA